MKSPQSQHPTLPFPAPHMILPLRKHLWPLISLLSVACNSGVGNPVKFNPGRGHYDTTPLAVELFEQNPHIQRRILYMPFGEAGERLGSLRFEAQSSFSFIRGDKVIEQSDSYVTEQDPLGNFFVSFQTPHDHIQAYQINSTFYIRHGKGHLRNKARRQVNSEQWGQLAYSSLTNALEPFRPFLTFSQGETIQHLGRETLEIALGLASKASQQDMPQDTLPNNQLPVSTPTLWRELAHPLSISGSLWVDKKSGVVVKSRLKGKLEVSDRDVRPTQLELSYESSITDIGKVRPIKKPDSIAEFRRKKPAHNRLAFFKNQLPSTSEVLNAKATTAKK